MQIKFCFFNKPWYFTKLFLFKFFLYVILGASDATSGHYLKNVRCYNCNKSAFVTFDNPNKAWLNRTGGCGDFNCTGLENVLI